VREKSGAEKWEVARHPGAERKKSFNSPAGTVGGGEKEPRSTGALMKKLLV